MTVLVDEPALPCPLLVIIMAPRVSCQGLDEILRVPNQALLMNFPFATSPVSFWPAGLKWILKMKVTIGLL